MLHSRSFLPLALAFVAATGTAQSGRSMKRLSPVVIGGVAAMAMQHPTTVAGNVYALAVCSPSYPGTLPLAIPGVVNGVLRLDPLAFGWLQFGVLDASGQTAPLSFVVPNDPLLVGASFDVQGMDLDAAGLITLTDDELETQVSAPPPASLNMAVISPGMFQMGSAAAPLDQLPYFNQAVAQPVHAVTITRPFWMGRREVTQAQYQALMGSNPSHFVGANRPVDTVSWSDALSVQEAAAGRLPAGYEYRLPTEAEWEYCCRAATTTEFHTGPGLTCAQANMRFSFHSSEWCQLGVGQTLVSGAYPANAWGLSDMHGNVREWCLDSWDLSANYPAAAVSDPLVSSGSFRVLRGGGWFSYSSFCRSAYRGALAPNGGTNDIGFRVVLAPLR